jgi:hypothetical protein
MEKKVLYLFNSARRPLYKQNLYRILALPVGSVTQFRYTIEHHVPSELLNSSLQGKESLIVFVDRFSDDSYTYYPIRKGKILKSYSKADRLILECRLGEYRCVHNQEDFTNVLKKSARGVPELTDGDPKNTRDGYYVQLGENVIDKLIVGEDCWLLSVKGISRTKALSEKHTAFMKISLTTKAGNKSEISYGPEGSAMLKAGKTYFLEVLYYDPEKGGVNKDITFSLQAPLKCYGHDQFSLGALTEHLSIPLGTDKALRSVRASISIIVNYESSKVYYIDLPVQISSRHLLWGTVFYFMIIFTTVIIEKTFASPSTFWSIILECLKWGSVIRVFIKLEFLPNLPTK